MSVLWEGSGVLAPYFCSVCGKCEIFPQNFGYDLKRGLKSRGGGCRISVLTEGPPQEERQRKIPPKVICAEVGRIPCATGELPTGANDTIAQNARFGRAFFNVRFSKGPSFGRTFGLVSFVFYTVFAGRVPQCRSGTAPHGFRADVGFQAVCSALGCAVYHAWEVVGTSAGTAPRS